MIKTLLTAYACLAAVGCGCSGEASRQRPAQQPINQNDSVLKMFTEKTGVTCPESAGVIAHNDGGGRDPSHGFYQWVVFSSSPIKMPFESEANEYRKMPLADTVKLIEVMSNHKIVQPQVAFVSTWQTNNYDYRGHLLRAGKGDYLLVQQFRKQ